jgi:hypothetical protein
MDILEKPTLLESGGKSNYISLFRAVRSPFATITILFPIRPCRVSHG